MGGTTYAVAGGKGGVGKTTTALNLAVALETAGTDAAVVDADLGMTNLGELAGIDPDRSIHDVLAGGASVEEATTRGPGGVTVLAGERDLDAYGRADPAELRPAIEDLRRDHDAVVVDTGAGLSHEALVPYGLADAVALVTTPGETAAVDTRKTADMVRQVGGTVMGTVVTRTHPGASGDDRGHDPDVDPTVDAVGEPLLATVPDAPDLAGSEPMVVTAPDSDPAAAYRRLAGRVAARADLAYSHAAAADADASVNRPAGATQD